MILLLSLYLLHTILLLTTMTQEATIKELSLAILEQLRVMNENQINHPVNYVKQFTAQTEEKDKQFPIKGAYCLSKKSYKKNGIPSGFTTISVIVADEVKTELDAFHKAN